MRTRNWIKVSFVAALFSISVMADHGNNGNGGNNGNNGNNGNGSFESSMVGSTPGTTVGGVASGGAPWALNQGSASVDSSGQIEVHVQGLLLATGAPVNLVGTVGPVQMVAASLVCGGSGGMVVASSTTGVPFSARGNAQIESNLTLPASCAAPIVLLRIFDPTAVAGSQLGPFIAVTGFNAGTPNAQNQNDHDRD